MFMDRMRMLGFRSSDERNDVSHRSLTGKINETLSFYKHLLLTEQGETSDSPMQSIGINPT